MTPFEAFVEPAGARTGLWRLLAGVPLILVIFALWFVLLLAGLYGVGFLVFSDEYWNYLMTDGLETVNTPGAVLLMLAFFLALGPPFTLSGGSCTASDLAHFSHRTERYRSVCS